MSGERRALLIATGSYTDATFASLRAPQADVAALAAVLRDPEIGGYAVDVLTDQPSHEVRVRLNELLITTAGRDDLVLVYVSGHGVKDETGQLYLATADTRRALLASTGVPAAFIRDLIDHSPARRVVVWLDCCYAGAFPAGRVPKAEGTVDVLSQLDTRAGRGCAVMTASTAIQYAFERGTGTDTDAGSVTGTAAPSVFTSAIVEGLRTGAADLDADGMIDAAELYAYVYDRVRATTPAQTPTRNDQVTGELYIAQNPRGPRLDPRLPLDIRQALRSGVRHFRLAAVAAMADLARTGDDLATETLRQLSTGSDQEVAAAAANALRTAGTPPKPTAPVAPPEPAPPEPAPSKPAPSKPAPPETAPQAAEVPTAPVRPPAAVHLPRGVSKVRPVESAVKTGEFLLVVLLVGVLWWLTAHVDLVRSPGGALVTAVVIPVILLAVIIDLARFGHRLAADQSVILVRARTPVRSVAFSPDGTLFSCAAGDAVTTWRTARWNAIDTVRTSERTEPPGDGPILRLAFGPAGALLAGAHASGLVTLWETTTWGRTRTVGDSQGRGAALAVSPDGRTLASVRRHHTIELWSTSTWTSRILLGHHDVITSLAFSPDGSVLASTSLDRIIRLWDVDRERVARVLSANDAVLHQVAFSPDGTRLAACGDGVVCVWETRTFTTLWACPTTSAAATCLAFSPDGALLASAGVARDIHVRDAATGRLVRTRTGHRGVVTALAFSPDGGVLASCGADRTVRLWSTAAPHRPGKR